MTVLRLIVVFTLLVLASPTLAEDDVAPRILVTFSDPGMSNAARTGPARPGYTRRASSYLVSVNVRRAANRVADEFGLELVDEWPIVPLRVHCLVYAVPEDTAVESLLDELRARPDIESAQRMNRFDVSGSRNRGGADPFAELQHNLDTLELSQAHRWSRGEGASVAIIDTGADVEHPDLVTQIRTYHDFVGGKAQEAVAEAHGTAVAGVIGAASQNGIGMTGIAPAADIAVLRACWYETGRAQAVCNSFTLAKALTHALESNTDVINLSIGGPSDALLARLVRLAHERGIVVVAAAPAEDYVGFPSDVAGVFVVASSPATDSASSTTRFFAPGNEILVPVPGGGFDYASGSSLSAAHVSGVIALLIAKRPRLDSMEVSRLLAASRMHTGASVNACRALAQMLGHTGCRGMAAASNRN